MSTTIRKTLCGTSWAIVAIVIWSGSLVMLSHGMQTSLNAYDLTALRFGVSGLILMPVVLEYRRQSPPLRLRYSVSMVAAFGAPYVLLIAYAMKSAPASAAGALNPGVMAMASLILGWIILGARIGVFAFAGLLVTAVGIILFTLPGGMLTSGHWILIVTGFMWAIYTLIVRVSGVLALRATAIVAVGSAAIYLPVYLVALPMQILDAPLEDVLTQAVFHGVLVSVVAIYAFNRSAELLGSVAGATLPAMFPVVTLGLGVTFLGETTTTSEVVSAALVTLGLLLVLAGKPSMS